MVERVAEKVVTDRRKKQGKKLSKATIEETPPGARARNRPDPKLHIIKKLEPEEPLPPVAGEDLTALLEEHKIRKLCIERLEACLSATVLVSGSEGSFQEHADYRTQLRAVEVGLGYCDGRPVERIHKIQENRESVDQEYQRAMQSPEFRRKLEEMVTEARSGEPPR